MNPYTYSLNGRYTVKDNEITVNAVLRKGEEEGTVFTVKGTVSGGIKEVVQSLVNETKRRMQ